MSPEEIFDNILSGEISYETQWFVEEWSEEERRREASESFLKESLEEREEYWMEVSNYRIDLKMAFFDIKRVFLWKRQKYKDCCGKK